MARGRRNAKREAAETRSKLEFERAERDRHEAEARAILDRRLTRRWGTERAGLDRLGALSRDLEKLHRDETRLLSERDELVGWLRQRGQSWAALSARTRLSRQALMKRTETGRPTHE